jgi:hypothetical protein
MNEGQGFALKDSVSGNANSGKVKYDDGHQTVAYTQPNWVADDFFETNGQTLSCGKKSTKQKDTVELADFNYGTSGSWSLSLWFRHWPENFENYQREQLIGHGDALFGTGSPNQFHLQLEKSNKLRTVYNTSWPAPTRYQDTPVNANHFDTEWHQYVFTASPSHKLNAWFVYIDGVSQAEGEGQRKMFDAVGPWRLCGRLKPATWSGGPPNTTQWDSRRYFLGKVGHFAVWDKALSPSQVTSLYKSYTVKTTTTTTVTTTVTKKLTETSHAVLRACPWLLSSLLVAFAVA